MIRKNLWLEKTDVGRREVAARRGVLDRRTRSLLIMVDGRTSLDELETLAKQLGLEAAAVEALLMFGLIWYVQLKGDDQAQKHSELATIPLQAKAPARTRSLAAARLYAMDIVVRTFGTPDHPMRERLIAATDVVSVRAAFEELLESLRRIATSTLIEHIESSFRDQLPE